MREGPNAKAERERQQKEKRMFVATAGVGFTTALLAAVAMGHRRAHRAAKLAGETIDSGQTRLVVRAFGLGTLYAFALVGCGTALANYYLKSRGVNSMAEFSDHMRGGAKKAIGTTFVEKLGVSEKEDREALEKVDKMVFEEDEGTGKKKIRFERIKGLLGRDSGDQVGSEEAEGGQRLSIGARMRAAFGFGKKRAEGDESTALNSDRSPAVDTRSGPTQGSDLDKQQ
ncbi:hypothetical protein GQ54DRAFT_341523 [Martensiomyces pterosporus]|nr:hypothetical protein GQ54DRAFT_341523 [Martensiomyces pterosporus]